VSEATATSYDEVPYAARAFHYTHPNRLATIAMLRGLEPAPAERCRMLELGCASGGNLLPMAEALPESRFVGLDLSPRQVADGLAIIAELGLHNIELRSGNILQIDASLGEFDYIVCHGVYSWVPAEVQDRILTICRENLAPNGVAYVSYNTYPGWHLRGLVRDLLYYQTRRFADPRTRLEEARGFLNFLAGAIPENLRVYRDIITREAQTWTSQADSYLLHEFLDEVNHPVYFHEFMKSASAKGLQYVGEARPNTMAAGLPRPVKQTLAERIPEPLAREQYLDFICAGTFRRTLLCHASVALDPAPQATRVTALQATALAYAVAAEPELFSNAAVEFQTIEKVSFSTNRPLLKTTLVCLHETWPEPVTVDTLWQTVVSRLPPPLKSDIEKDGPRPIAEILLDCFLSNLVELHRRAPRFVARVSARPLASRLARLQAQEGLPITSLRHRGTEIDGFDRVVLQLLDGTRDRAALLAKLAELVAGGEFDLHQDNQPVRDPQLIRQMLDRGLDPCLDRLARSALLVE
jgi:methyltransferase-like protein/SAM-dependent methyltransferase